MTKCLIDKVFLCLLASERLILVVKNTIDSLQSRTSQHVRKVNRIALPLKIQCTINKEESNSGIENKELAERRWAQH
ncbi:hypothetical protein DBQ68_03890 [Lactobacillus sp. DS15_6]|uniref:Uncharacterized protein n=2 Tax=Lacticaseibacillus paracasei TaxID=1597 RepID=A0A829GIC1_LACPA|nr:hypothetical protein A3778_09730 [Lacticaseibacillus paracasei]EPC56904.1 hypothetical protein Lpp123_04431 [Lacticaseibacillus paracasei subsp. paracasei Lpp123]EPC87982.1 hypothetical protein Lpp43_03211 [Lacticaseibacillus paracasei subsp. paracasei Lpp43]EPD06074.1 hypothetical protein Lpp78_05571 [Lacticaseibacillus paracasei subsp. paracasei CNCM I-2877]PTS51801.1 hypothetical protein DBQ62_02905 [Lactobacillus sp. DS9_6]PTS63711.1 hypothetical protein DBQ68_03890 [Lactobacillus sp. D